MVCPFFLRKELLLFTVSFHFFGGMIDGPTCANDGSRQSDQSRRQAVSLSQQATATRSGLTYQAIHATEAGQFVPNTLVALRPAYALGSRVEELFQLSEEHTRVEAEWMGETPGEATIRRCIRLARPLIGAKHAFAAADGVTVPAAYPCGPQG
jgi:putative transcriptional regulator